MTDQAHRPLRQNAEVHLRGAWIAAVSLAVLVIGKLDLLPFDPSAFAVVGILVAFVLMFISRKADEYVASLWSAGTSAAFTVVVFWLLMAPMAEGFFDGLTGNDGGMQFPVDLASIASLTAFLIAFFWRQFRGG